MNARALLPLAAVPVGLVVSVTRRIAPVLLELPGGVPSPGTVSLAVLAGRFAAFVLVYGLVLGLAYWVGTRGEDESGDAVLALATGVAAAVAFVAGSVAVLFFVYARQDLLVTAAATVGSGVGVGVQLAVVTVAGLALGRR